MSKSFIEEVALEKSWRLLNHGPTVLVSATYNGVDNVMAVGWSCVLDFSPPKVTVVLSSETKTRELIDGSGFFAVQVPTVAQIKITNAVGNSSLHDDPHKLKNAGVEIFRMPHYDLPLVSGCSGWLICKVIPEKHNQETYDLYIGEIIAAWADSRVFKDGHWHFEKADPSMRSIHHIAGGHYYAIGEAVSEK